MQTEKLTKDTSVKETLLLENENLRKRISALADELYQIEISFQWKLLKKMFALVDWLIPIRSKRRNYIRNLLWSVLPTQKKEAPRIDSRADRHTGGEDKYFELYVDKLKLAEKNTSISFEPMINDPVDSSKVHIKTVAFYLPQYHPIPENDMAWGKGFTEWTNVSKSVPQFVNHYQPRLPGDFGFYDLRLKNVQLQQIALAKQFGIHGFCYHYYWFNGKKILYAPLQRMLEDPELDLPFCLCWANENWTKRWDGGDDDIIIAQKHSAEDDIEFIKSIEKALRDRRYIRIKGKPLLVVYRPELLPNPADTADRWREYARKKGLGELYVVSAATFGFKDYRGIGFDGLVQFPPHNIKAPEIIKSVEILNPCFSGHIYDYIGCAENAINALNNDNNTIPCVMLAWDNTARNNSRAKIYYNCSPETYKGWLKNAFDYVMENDEREKIVFVNAWNEWAEGTYLEPDKKYGYAYLNATASLMRSYYDKPKNGLHVIGEK